MDDRLFFKNIKASSQGDLLLKGAYLLHGDEDYACTMAVRQAQLIVSDAARELNTQTLQAPSALEVIEACESMPFFDRIHIVTVMDFPSTKEEEKTLAEYCPKVPDTTLLLLVKRGKVKSTCPYAQVLGKMNRVIEFEKYDSSRAGQFIKKRADMRGVTIDPRVSRHMIEMVGVDLAALESAVFRVADYVGTGHPITIEALEECITPNTEYRVFDILTKLINGNRQEGLTIIHAMLKSGESPLGLASFTESRLRQMLSIKRMIKSGMKEPDIIRSIGGNPYAAKMTIQDAIRFKDTKKLSRAMKAMASVDYQVKSGAMTEEDALMCAVLESF